MDNLNNDLELLRSLKKQNHEFKICFDKIDDENIKKSVKEIIVISDKIYKEIVVNTEKVKKANNYIRYYLASVIKVVDRYVTFKQAGINNKEAINLYEKIEAFLPRAYEGINKVYESLFNDEILDIDSEIKVMLMELGMK